MLVYTMYYTVHCVLYQAGTIYSIPALCLYRYTPLYTNLYTIYITPILIHAGEVTIMKNQTASVGGGSGDEVIIQKPLVKLFRGQSFGELALDSSTGMRQAG